MPVVPQDLTRRPCRVTGDCGASPRNDVIRAFTQRMSHVCSMGFVPPWTIERVAGDCEADPGAEVFRWFTWKSLRLAASMGMSRGLLAWLRSPQPPVDV